jgi:quinol monooxygenase YgiN
MSFIQIIEYKTSRYDEIEALVETFLAETEGRRTVVTSKVTKDRDNANTYVTIVEFPSYEDAMKNSEDPATGVMAEQMAKLCDGPPTFRNLDVVRNLDG